MVHIGAGAIQTGGARAPPFSEVGGGGKMGTDGALHPGTVLPGHNRIETIGAFCPVPSKKQTHSLHIYYYF